MRPRISNRGVPVLYIIAVMTLVAVLSGCAQDGESRAVQVETQASEHEEVAAAFDREFGRIAAKADSIDRIYQPLPLLRAGEEQRLRTYLEAQQLPRARQLGIAPGAAEADLDRLVGDGRLVRLEESTSFWVVRELDFSSPYVTPDVEVLLRDIGERFQGRLADLGLPAYRFEITSVLRSAGDQERLRRVNPNAATGESTHQFGTTVDIAYNAFAAPRDPIVATRAPEADWLEERLARIADLFAETVAARRAREMEAILGHTLIEIQDEGRVMVTMERLQPVYHITVARRLATN